MAFSRSAHISRYKKDIDPVTDVTLILVGLSTSAKTQVVNQILHHLKGCAVDTNAESEPIPECNCQVQEGKVLGLKVTTVNTPDVPEEEEDNIRTLGNEMKEFATGDYVVVMVMAAATPDSRGIDRERLLRFNDMTFGNQSHRYSLAILTSEAIEMDQRSHKENKRTGKDASTQETICSQDILTMTFDLGASKEHNDKQVQVLFNHAKTLVRRKREDPPTKANEDETVTGSHDLPVTNGGGEAHSCATTTSNAQDQHQSEFELTTDSLRPEEINELDVCLEVFELNLPSPEEQRGEHRYQTVLEDREREHNPGNISFVTANPIACGDFQC